MRRGGRSAARVVLALALLSACTGGADDDTAAPTSPSASPTRSAEVVWLCRPFMEGDNPCDGDLGATVISPDGRRRTEKFEPAFQPQNDCFYVYPTVSRAPSVNAPREPSPEIIAAVRAQAARFASVCALYVPIYRQLTTSALISGKFFDPQARAIAEQDVRDAWHDYLTHDNDGRGVVLIGHSQGAMALTKTVAAEMDKDPAVRRLLISALLLGGQVTTAAGKDVGGDFANLPACRRPGQTGCVIGYSAFPAEPPVGAFFGRVTAGRQPLCTDPTILSGRRDGLLDPYLPAAPVKGFRAYPGSLRASCRSTADASWLQVSRVPGSKLPEQTQQLGPSWGLHVGDVNLALGDLVEAVRLQVEAWATPRR